MQQYLRFQRYDDPSRQITTQIHPDISIDEVHGFAYASPIKVGDDDTPVEDWPIYFIGNIPQISEMEDPNIPGRKALLLEVFLIRQEEWELFMIPESIHYIQEMEKLVDRKSLSLN
ncbi:hypothetical protein IC229_05945 [Spirosoma sp. BT702]|uniref:Uncharacterized protein n=1 Tax=Spirosoma profusum TaxID=2771354 RepID=A0A927AQD1_9BACT|nr:hypothetical protein [Spirosoma profusum]MBD2700168.1 hypothetical protein [Spirosoma profusum]